MRIIRLQAEGFKRLVAVDITPDGDLVEVRGDNGNGKSSVLDAIFAALAGAAAAPIKPVRQGEEFAIIRLDLGEIVVTRIFTPEGTTRLKVTNADGSATFSSGQTMLDQLVGHISFDPLAFARLKPEEQAEELRRLVTIDVDLDKMAADQKRDYADRRDVNRDAKNLEARLAAIPVVDKPETLPDRAALVDALAKASEQNSDIEKETERRRMMEADANSLRLQIGELESKLVAAKTQLHGLEDTICRFESTPIACPVDIDDLREQIAQADRVRVIVDQIRMREELDAEHKALVTRADALSKRMLERENERKEAIASAKMPVDGLSLEVDEEGKLGVVLNDIPFSQASSAEQLKVSTAVAMAANPTLRVIRIKDGSLLDKHSLETLRTMAAENDFQIWGEFVGEGEGVGVIMEAGKVRGAPEPEPLDRPRRRRTGDAETASDSAETGGNAEVRGGALDEPFDPKTGELPPKSETGASAHVSHETATGGPVGGQMASSGAPTTLFERMSDLSKASEAPKRPRAVTSLQTKPVEEN